jgi:hypothetical protein
VNKIECIFPIKKVYHIFFSSLLLFILKMNSSASTSAGGEGGRGGGDAGRPIGLRSLDLGSGNLMLMLAWLASLMGYINRTTSGGKPGTGSYGFTRQKQAAEILVRILIPRLAGLRDKSLDEPLDTLMEHIKSYIVKAGDVSDNASGATGASGGGRTGASPALFKSVAKLILAFAILSTPSQRFKLGVMRSYFKSLILNPVNGLTSDEKDILTEMVWGFITIKGNATKYGSYEAWKATFLTPKVKTRF